MEATLPEGARICRIFSALANFERDRLREQPGQGGGNASPDRKREDQKLGMPSSASGQWASPRSVTLRCKESAAWWALSNRLPMPHPGSVNASGATSNGAWSLLMKTLIGCFPVDVVNTRHSPVRKRKNASQVIVQDRFTRGTQRGDHLDQVKSVACRTSVHHNCAHRGNRIALR
jgi:hypothetical protein